MKLNFKFIEKTKLYFIISGILIAVGILSALFNGFKQDIEFAGGTAMVIDMGKSFDKEKVKQVVEKAVPNSRPDVIVAGENNTQVSIKITKPLDTNQSKELFEAVKKEFKLNIKTYESNDKIAPTISNEIKTKALSAVVIAVILILIYIASRFSDYRFGVASVAALFHDVIIVLAVYTIFSIPLNDAFIAAMLTVIGYSMNDTVIVFDRIREKLKIARRQPLEELVDTSINETLVRSINTSLTTIITTTVLYFLGSESVKQFALPLIIGIITGTYSSIFIASPVWVILKKRDQKKRKVKTA